MFLINLKKLNEIQTIKKKLFEIVNLFKKWKKWGVKLTNLGQMFTVVMCQSKVFKDRSDPDHFEKSLDFWDQVTQQCETNTA